MNEAAWSTLVVVAVVKRLEICSVGTDIRVVKVDIDAVRCGLLERENVDCDAMQDVSGGSKELDKAPTLLLIGLQYAGQHWDHEGLQTPVKKKALVICCQTPRGFSVLRTNKDFFPAC